MKLLITALKVGTSARGNNYARIAGVNLDDGSVLDVFVDPKVVEGIEAVDLSELSALADEVTFDQKGRIVSLSEK